MLKYIKSSQTPIEMKEITEEEKETSCMYVGAHLSMQGGVHTVFERMDAVGGRAVGMFLKNQKTYNAKPLEEKDIKEFQRLSGEKHACILPHASYLINLAQPDPEKAEKSYLLFLDELKRCDALNISLCNFHPGSNVGKLPVEKACKLISDNINKALKETQKVVAVIENMAGQGNVMGSTFKEIRMIIDGVEDKSRVGVCLDTCHLFGAGYDIRTKESFASVVKEFDDVVGLKYLKGMHLNDSKMPLGSKRDRHESIGKGLIGLEAFSFIMNSSIFSNIPLILETPNPEKYKEEIHLLYTLIK
ncbi:hypothetical protein NECID01_0917 [Nematocida sp. AWRm77]|nr:hypothetical protein NECID01_0917 [Nematocida sp. AWRm77]